MPADATHGGCEHEAALLLPWFVTGRLEPAERARVEAHLADCADCRADLVGQRDLRGWLQEDERVEYAPQPSLQKLLTRIDELEREMPAATVEPAAVQTAVAGPAPAARSFVPRWMIAAVLLQAVGLGVLGALLVARSPSRDDAARFVTLSTPEAVASAAPRVRVVFTPDTTTRQLAGLLGSEHAEIVAGPSEAGAYTLVLRDTPAAHGNLPASLARLRASPHVLFAEPAAGGAASPP